MPKKTKESRIRAERKRLEGIFAALPENKYAIAAPLIENAAFMRVTLEDLRAEINENGCADEYQNGANQSGTKMSAALQSYNTTMKMYNTVNARLEAMLPPDAKTDKISAFLNAD